MKRVHWIVLAVLFLISLVVPYVFAEGGHDGHWWHHVPGFWGAFGFLSCALIIIISKAIGKAFLVRKPGYYDVPPAPPADELEELK